MGHKLGRVLFGLWLIFFSVVLPSVPAYGADEGVTITNPKEGESIVNTSAQFTGTSPSSTIVSVVITDTDTARAGIAHQQGGKVEGTVTADSSGHWSYVPQHTLVPGQFSVKASFVNQQNKVVESQLVNFVVLNAKGSSVQISESLVQRIALFGVLAVLLIAAIVIFLIRRRRRLNVKQIGEEAEAIEEELEHTMEQLVKTNAEIAKLNEQMHKKESPPSKKNSDSSLKT